MYFKQNTLNDCAYTCICIAARKSWVLLKNQEDTLNRFRQFVNFPSKRTTITKANRRSKIKPKFNPYTCGVGLYDHQIKVCMLVSGFGVTTYGPRRLKDLPPNNLYFISLPSKNFHHAGHLVIFNKGRLFDPSRRRKYKFSPFLKFGYALRLTPKGNTLEKILEEMRHTKEPSTNLVKNIVSYWWIAANKHIDETLEVENVNET